MTCSTVAIPLVTLQDVWLAKSDRSIVQHFLKQSDDHHSWILKNINFSLMEGDHIGIVGSNGAGKTSLLRVIAGCIPVTSGVCRSSCNVTPLISNIWIRSGNLTGYDQALSAFYVMQNGHNLHESGDFLEKVCELSQLTDSIMKLPVGTYSRGMKTRLSFGISVALRPEVMVIDEGLGTGDKKFIKYARKVLEELRSSCRALVLATHSETLMKSLCSEALTMHQGVIVSRDSL